MIAFLISISLYLFVVLAGLIWGLHGALMSYTLCTFLLWWLPLPFALWGLCHHKQRGWNIAALVLILPWIASVISMSLP